MPNLDKLLRLLIEIHEDTPMGTLVIFFIMLCGIALVIDIMLTHTFPAFTLIVLLLFAGNIGIKLYEKYLMRKKKPWDK